MIIGKLLNSCTYREYLQYFQEAIQRQNRKKIDSWLLALKSADALHPSVCYRYERALILKHLRDFWGAESQIQKALNLMQTFGKKHNINHDKFRCLLLASKLYLEMQRCKKALSYLELAFAEYPFDAESHLLITKIQKKLKPGRVEKALWRSYLCAPNSSKAWFKLIDHKNQKRWICGSFHTK